MMHLYKSASAGGIGRPGMAHSTDALSLAIHWWEECATEDEITSVANKFDYCHDDIDALPFDALPAAIKDYLIDQAEGPGRIG